VDWTSAKATTTQNAGRVEPIRQPATDRAHDHGQHDETGHLVGGVRLRQAVRVLEVCRQVDAERDVPAEPDGVQGGRLPGDRQPGHSHEPGPSGSGRHHASGRIAHRDRGGRAEDREDDGDEHERGADAVRIGQLDGGQCADRCATHARAEDADREAAASRGEPRADERHSDRESGAGDAEEEPADE
jgi:hypothetical protein